MCVCDVVDQFSDNCNYRCVSLISRTKILTVVVYVELYVVQVYRGRKLQQLSLYHVSVMSRKTIVIVVCRIVSIVLLEYIILKSSILHHKYINATYKFIGQKKIEGLLLILTRSLNLLIRGKYDFFKAFLSRFIR